MIFLRVLVSVFTASSLRLRSESDGDDTITELSKRDITLVDKANMSLTCTVWGKDAESFEEKGGKAGSVIAIKAARVSDYNGMCRAPSILLARNASWKR